MPTIEDVAEFAGVSTDIALRVLMRKPTSDESRRKVVGAINTLGLPDYPRPDEHVEVLPAEPEPEPEAEPQADAPTAPALEAPDSDDVLELRPAEAPDSVYSAEPDAEPEPEAEREAEASAKPALEAAAAEDVLELRPAEAPESVYSAEPDAEPEPEAERVAEASTEPALEAPAAEDVLELRPADAPDSVYYEVLPAEPAEAPTVVAVPESVSLAPASPTVVPAEAAAAIANELSTLFEDLVDRLARERRERIQDVALTNELVIEGWRNVDRRLGRLEMIVERLSRLEYFRAGVEPRARPNGKTASS